MGTKRSKNTPIERLTQKEAAKRLALTPRQLRNLSHHGAPREEDGLYPWPELQYWYEEFKQQEAVDRKAGGGSSTADFFAARAKREAAVASLKELELEERRGVLVHVDQVEELVAQPLSIVRNRLLSFPARAAPRLAGEVREIPDIVHILQLELSEILEDLVAEDPFENGSSGNGGGDSAG